MRTRGVVATLLAVSAAGCTGPPSESDPADGAPPPEGVFGRSPPAVGGIPSVVTLSTPAPIDLEPRARAPLIDQLGLVFAPTELLLRVGEPFDVTNSESIGHNVHIRDSDADTTVLNVDTDPSQRVQLAIEASGAYTVGCDVHPGMRAVIYVTNAAYAAFAEDDGLFSIPEVSPGTYTLSVWSADPEQRSQRQITVTGPSTEVTLGP